MAEHPPSPKLPSHKSKSHLLVGPEVFEQAAAWQFLASLRVPPTNKLAVRALRP